MSFPTIGVKRNYGEISGTLEYPAQKRPKAENLLLKQKIDDVNFEDPERVSQLAKEFWSSGFFKIKEGELIFAFEACPLLDIDQLLKMLAITPAEIREGVRSCTITNYLYMGPRLPGILLDLCPNLELSSFRYCHEWLADHAIFVGGHARQFKVNKGLLGITHSCSPGELSREVLTRLDPSVFENCLQITVGLPLTFTEERKFGEFLQFMEGLCYLHLTRAPPRITTLFEECILHFLEDQKKDILRLEEMCAWLEQLSQLLHPFFQAGKFMRVRNCLVCEFYQSFYKKFDVIDRPESMPESYLTHVVDELDEKSEAGDCPLERAKNLFIKEVCDFLHTGVFSEESLADNQEVKELLQLPFVRKNGGQILERVTSHTYKDLTPASIRNMLLLLEYFHEQGIGDRRVLQLKIIDFLQFDVRPRDAEKALFLSQQHPDTQFHYILMLRKRNHTDALVRLRQAHERSRDSEERKDLTRLLAYCTYKDEGNLEGALELIERFEGPLFDHLRAYFLAHTDAFAVDKIEQLMAGASFTQDPFTLYIAFILGKDLPQGEISWNVSHTFTAFFASEVLSELPLEWQMKVFPSFELLRLFKVNTAILPIPSAPPLTPTDTYDLSEMLLDALELDDK